MGEPELHLRWERDPVVRDRARSIKSLLDWPVVDKLHLVGHANMRSFLINARVIEMTAAWWCEQVEEAQSVRIETIRKEGRLQSISCSS